MSHSNFVKPMLEEQPFISLNDAVKYAYENYYGHPFGRRVAPERLRASNRVLHGILHAGSCMELIPRLDELYRKHGQKAYTRALAKVAKYFNLTVKGLIKLVQITALFHDCARQADGKDEWEEASAAELKAYLLGKNINAKLAEILAQCVIKNEEDFNKKINELCPEFHELDYLRQLINMADTIEIVRDRSTFHFKFLPLIIKKPFTITEALIADLIKLVKEIAKKTFSESRSNELNLIIEISPGRRVDGELESEKCVKKGHDNTFKDWYAKYNAQENEVELTDKDDVEEKANENTSETQEYLAGLQALDELDKNLVYTPSCCRAILYGAIGALLGVLISAAGGPLLTACLVGVGFFAGATTVNYLYSKRNTEYIAKEISPQHAKLSCSP